MDKLFLLGVPHYIGGLAVLFDRQALRVPVDRFSFLDQRGEYRITSYNVCYTKLLRVALVYFGGWRPVGVLLGALLFSMVNALQLWISYNFV